MEYNDKLARFRQGHLNPFNKAREEEPCEDAERGPSKGLYYRDGGEGGLLKLCTWKG